MKQQSVNGRNNQVANTNIDANFNPEVNNAAHSANTNITAAGNNRVI